MKGNQDTRPCDFYYRFVLAWRMVITMDILLSNASGIPIYQQIVTQIRQMIMNGELAEGDSLPSMRLLAKELRISLITTKRAYEELEGMGLIVTVGGKGCFVGETSPQQLLEERRKDMEQAVAAAAAAALSAGVPLEEAKRLLEELYKKV